MQSAEPQQVALDMLSQCLPSRPPSVLPRLLGSCCCLPALPSALAGLAALLVRARTSGVMTGFDAVPVMATGTPFLSALLAAPPTLPPIMESAEVAMPAAPV